MLSRKLTKDDEDLKDETAKYILSNVGKGFNFDLSVRNSMILGKEKNVKLPKFTKTGTTIAGVVFKNGVILGADTRATAGPIVAQKNCEKIHYMAPNIYCCGAGTAADTENVTEMISSQLTLMRLNTGTQSRIVSALTRLKRHLFRYMGYVSAALVLGGVDSTGPHLHTVWPHGSTDTLPYVTMGSGSLAAMAVFENDFKPNMTEEEAIKLVIGGIRSGISNDLGSGSNVDICIITKDKTEFHRNIFKTEILSQNLNNYPIKFKIGDTQVLQRQVIEHVEDEYSKPYTIEEDEDDKKEDEETDDDDDDNNNNNNNDNQMDVDE